MGRARTVSSRWVRDLFDRDAAGYYRAKYGGADPAQQYAFLSRLELVARFLVDPLVRCWMSAVDRG